MSRPAVSVVMPFAGDAAARREAISVLLALAVSDEDELILADNSVPASSVTRYAGLTVIHLSRTVVRT